MAPTRGCSLFNWSYWCRGWTYCPIRTCCRLSCLAPAAPYLVASGVGAIYGGAAGLVYVYEKGAAANPQGAEERAGMSAGQSFFQWLFGTMELARLVHNID